MPKHRQLLHKQHPARQNCSHEMANEGIGMAEVKPCTLMLLGDCCSLCVCASLEALILMRLYFMTFSRSHLCYHIASYMNMILFYQMSGQMERLGPMLFFIPPGISDTSQYRLSPFLDFSLIRHLVNDLLLLVVCYLWSNSGSRGSCSVPCQTRESPTHRLCL